MKTLKHKILATAMMLMAVSACSKESSGGSVTGPVLSASPLELVFESAASSQEVNVTAPSKPNYVSSASDWCTVTAGAFAQKSVIKVNVTENQSAEERKASVSIVCGDERVRLSVTQKGREVTPEQPEDFLAEIVPGTNNAWTVAKKLGLGWNLGNQLDAQNNGIASETAWGNAKATQATFDGLKAKGITAVRIPVTWLGHIGAAPEYKIDEAWMNRVAEVVGYAEKAGLMAIVNIHHDGADSKYWLSVKRAASSSAEYQTITAEFKAVWKQIAEKFADKGDFLIFEPFNELHDCGWGWGDNRTDGGAQYRVVNQWAQEFVNVVRETGGNNASRYLGIPGYCTNPDLTIENLVLPQDSAEGKLLVAVHCYDPHDYTLEAKYDEWGHTAVNKPAPSDEKPVVEVMAKLKAKYIDNGIPVYFGECGCVNRPTSRQTSFQKYYLEFFFRACRNYGIAPFLWDNGAMDTGRETSGFINHSTGEYIANGAQIIPALKNAMFNTEKSYTLKSVYDNAPR